MRTSELIIAPPGVRNRQHVLFDNIIALTPGNDYSSVLYLGPDAPFLAHAKKLFHKYHASSDGSKAYIPFQAVTIRQLSSGLYDAFGTDTIISDEIRTLLLLQLLEEKNLGYAHLLSGLLNKIRHYIPDRNLGAVRAEIDRLIFEDKARDRAINAMDTLQTYEDLLDRETYIDSERALLASIPLIEQHLSPALTVIDSFHDPTPLETEILRSLIKKSAHLLVLAENRDPFTDIMRNAKPVFVTTLRPSSRRSGSGYVAYSSIEDEVEGIAKSIKGLLLQGRMPGDITLSFPALSKYLPMVTRIFKRYGIPVSVGEYPLSNSKPLIAINEIITCIEDDYPRTDFLSVLMSPLFPAISRIIKEQAVGISYRAGIIKGKESWRSIYSILMNETANISGEEKEQIKKFQEEVDRIIDLIEDIHKSQNLSSYTDTFFSALEKLGFFEALGSGTSDHAEGIAKVISGKFAELRILAAADKHEGNPGMYLRYVLENLSIADAHTEGVRIVPYDQASGLETKELFFGGMLEGDFPSKPSIDPIMPEKVKHALGMPYLEYYLNRQRQYFIRLLNISEKPPYFSCPSAEGDKVFLPSPFLNWNQELSPVQLDIFSDEEVLVREGIIRGPEPGLKMLWDSSLDLNRASLKMIGDTFRGYLNVTDIDSYRKCPMRFYIERVLRLAIQEPPQFEVQARLWGSLSHKVMEQLFSERDMEIDKIESRLFQCLEEVLKQFPIDNFWGGVAKEIFRKLLPNIKEQELDLRMQGFAPVMVEKKLTADIDGLKLKGKVDRIDRNRSQEQRNTDSELIHPNSVILLDYKTGNIDPDSLQMPLYALMWEELSSEPVDKVGYYSLKEGRITWYPKKGSMEEYINEKLITTRVLVSNMRKGVFPPEPVNISQCRYCSHSPLCKR
jgi:ATP-dependent helicase/DNAse subunit B